MTENPMFPTDNPMTRIHEELRLDLRSILEEHDVITSPSCSDREIVQAIKEAWGKDKSIIINAPLVAVAHKDNHDE